MSQRQTSGTALANHSLWSLAGHLAYLAINVGALPLYMRWLGDSHYGLLSLLLSIVAPLGIVTSGVAQATIKHVSSAMARKDPHRAAQAVASNLAFNLGAGLLGAAVIVLLAPVIGHRAFKLDPADSPLFEQCMVWTAASWLVIQVSGTFTSALVGQQRFRAVALGSSASSAVTTLLGLWVLHQGHGLKGVMIARTVSGAAVCLLWYWACRRAFAGGSLTPRFHREMLRSTWRFGSWQTLSAFATQVAAQADKLMLGRYVSVAAVGLLNVPQLMYGTLHALVSKLGDSMFPAISMELAAGNARAAIGILMRSGPLLSLAMVTLQGTLYVLAPDAIALYLKGRSDYEILATIVRLLSLAAIISAPSVPIQQYLLGGGAARSLAAIAFASALGTLIAAVLLVPRFGLRGAAWGNLLSIAATRPLMHYIVWRRHLSHLVPARSLFAALYGTPLLGGGLVVLLGVARDWIGWQPSWAIAPIAGVAVVAILFSLTALMDRGLPGGSMRSCLLASLAAATVWRLKRLAGWKVSMP